MDLLQAYLEQKQPVITSIDTIDLPYWNKQSLRHAVVVVGLDDTTVSINDPSFSDAPKIVERTQFDSAWLRREYIHAVIQKSL